jgi:1,4-alpha-glucan branching enzyme
MLAMTAFDAELFGHWWFEGPTFLYYVIKWIAADPEIKSVTCSEYLDQNPADIWVHLPESSWGRNYDSSTWINPEVEWTWERIYHAEKEIQYLAKDFASRKNDQTLQRIIKQAIRELFILQASDWQFMITNWSTRDLAEKRVVERHEDFKRLAKMAWDYGHGRNVPEEEWVFLHHCEMRNDVFPEPELDWFSKLDYPPKSKEDRDTTDFMA